jgi:hypothetical protein
LGTPTVLAFFSGGYFAEPRLIAAIVMWALVLALVVAGIAPLPRSRPGWLVLGGLVSLTVWTGISIAWAPLGGPALDSLQRLVLYTGALLVAIGALRSQLAMQALEPALAGGAAIVVGYGLSGRLVPGIVELERSRSAGGRLEQPITYWNAEGALAAVGLVLCARLAGDRTRPAWIRALAASAAVPLSAGVYLSFSRGAIAAAVVGLVVLVSLAPTRGQWRGAAIVLATGLLAALVCGLVPAVASLEGSQRGRDGALVLITLVALAVVAAYAVVRFAAEDAELLWLRRARPVAAGLIAVVAIGLLVGGLAEKPSQAELSEGAGFGRLKSVSSNRYEYWRVGLNAFADEPLTGLGGGGFRVAWLKERPIPEAVRDAHSLQVEAAAELGIVGLLALGVMLAGVFCAGRRALREAGSGAVAGACSALVVWILHASVDWDWQFPAVTLPAVALAGALVVLSEPPEAD